MIRNGQKKLTTNVPRSKSHRWEVKREGNGLPILWNPSGNGVQFKQSEERERIGWGKGGIGNKKTTKAVGHPAFMLRHLRKQNRMKIVTE